MILLKHTYKVVIISILCVLMSACANMQPPPGGPEDKTAPFVDTAGLASGAINFSSKEIWVHFSEYVDKGKVMENIFLSPEKRLEYSWSGKELNITFAEPLDSNTTYSLTLGTDYTDLRGNKPSAAHTIVFSTGSSLDSSVIRGTLDDENPTGVYAFLYPIDGINPDTIDYSKTKPRYRTQIGTNKSFEFRALASGKYRLIAVRDQLKNGVVDQGDGYGTLTDDVTLTKGEDRSVKLRVGMMKPLQATELVEVRSISSQAIEAIFSSSLDTSSLDIKNWVLTDTLGTNPLNILANHISLRSPKNVVLYTAKPLDSIKYRRLRITGDSINGLRDSAGLKIPDSLATQIFSTSTERDTLPPAVVKISQRDSATNVSRNPVIRIVMNTALQKTQFDKSFTLLQGTTTVPLQISWRGDNECSISPVDTLRSDSWYEVRFRTAGIRGVNGVAMKDTLYKLRFKTLDTRNLSTLKAVLIDSSSSACPQYVVIVSNKQNVQRKVILRKEGEIVINGCEAGDYTLQVFCDDDSNGTYSYGTLNPFHFSELYTIRPEPITLKARWTVEDVKVVLKK